jgi:16S rRNA (uracil1498-N3)-methyltransferase
MRWFYVEPFNIQGDRAVVEGAEAEHVRNVLRLGRGAAVGLVDGRGGEYSAVIERMAAGRVELTVADRRTTPEPAVLRLCAAQGFLKEKKMDRLVRQLSELGVARWVPFTCERAVVRPVVGRGEVRRERWRRIAIDALKQSRRGTLMEIADVARFEQLLEEGRSCDVRILFWEKAPEPLSRERCGVPERKPVSAMVVLGPEGGFSAEEAAAAEAAGFVVAGLGPRILRAETAAVAACALVQFLWGDLGLRQKNLDKK